MLFVDMGKLVSVRLERVSRCEELAEGTIELHLVCLISLIYFNVTYLKLDLSLLTTSNEYSIKSALGSLELCSCES